MTSEFVANRLHTLFCLGLVALCTGCGDGEVASNGDSASAPDSNSPAVPRNPAESTDFEGSDAGSETNVDPLLSGPGALLTSDSSAESEPGPLGPVGFVSAHASVPKAPDPKAQPELADAVWNVLLPSATGGADPSLERLTPLTVHEGTPVEFYEEHWPDGDLRLQGHRTVQPEGAASVLHGPEWRWYDNGQLQLRRNYKLGKSYGKSEEWHESGFKKSEGNFVNDQLSGPWARWNSLGSLWKMQGFREGLPDGKQWVFFKTGAVSQLVEWELGKKVGVDHNWNKGGYPLEDSQWKDGKRHGHHLKWHGREKPAVEKHFVEGKAHGPWLEWWPDGTPRLVGQMVDGERSGEWRIWSLEGVLITRENYAKSQYHGEREAWSNAGIRIFEGTFEDGKPTGTQTTFFEGGGPKTLNTYSPPGVLEGPMGTWHPNGKKASEGAMKDGKRDGYWSLWDEDGKLLKAWSGTYKEGQRIGD